MTAFEIPGFSWTLPSDADLSTGAGQFRFVDVNSDSEAIAPTLNGRAVGVRQNKPQTLEATAIVSGGISFVEASEAIAAGNNVATVADGRAKVADTTGETILGICIVGAAAAGELCSVMVCPNVLEL